MNVTLYHFTLRLVAERIMREGFRNSDPESVRDSRWEGVWFADIALAEDGALDPQEFVTVAVEAPAEEELGV